MRNATEAAESPAKTIYEELYGLTYEQKATLFAGLVMFYFTVLFSYLIGFGVSMRSSRQAEKAHLKVLREIEETGQRDVELMWMKRAEEEENAMKREREQKKQQRAQKLAMKGQRIAKQAMAAQAQAQANMRKMQAQQQQMELQRAQKQRGQKKNQAYNLKVDGNSKQNTRKHIMKPPSLEPIHAGDYYDYLYQKAEPSLMTAGDYDEYKHPNSYS